LRDAQEHSYNESYEKWYSTIVTKTLEIVLKYSKNSFDIGAEFAEASDRYSSMVSDKGLIGVGLTMVLNPLCAIYSASGALALSAKTTFKALASAIRLRSMKLPSPANWSTTMRLGLPLKPRGVQRKNRHSTRRARRF
jgi:hypothetical protein